MAKNKLAVLSVLLGSIAALTQSVIAAELIPDASVGVTSSDNATRNTTDPGSDYQIGIRSGLLYLRDGDMWDIELRGAVTRLEYSGDELPGDTRAWMRLQSQLLLIPDRMSWEVMNDYGQVATDPFGAFRPDDLTDVNFFSTGPDFAVPTGLNGRIELEGRYSKLDFAGLNSEDNNRYSVNAAYAYRMSSIRTIGVAAFAQRVEFGAGSTLPDYKLQSATVVASTSPRRMNITIQAGLSHVDDGVNQRSGPLYMISLERLLAQGSEFSMMVRKGFSDGADSIRFGQSGGNDAILIPQNVRVITVPFKQTMIGMGYSRRGAKMTFSLSPYYASEKISANSPLNRENYGFSLALGRMLSPNSSLGFNASFMKNDYRDNFQDADDVSVGLNFSRRLSRTLNLSLRAERYERSGSVASFNENRYGLAVTYEPRTSNVAQRPTFMQRTRGLSGQPTSSFRPRQTINEREP